MLNSPLKKPILGSERYGTAWSFWSPRAAVGKEAADWVRQRSALPGAVSVFAARVRGGPACEGSGSGCEVSPRAAREGGAVGRVGAWSGAVGLGRGGPGPGGVAAGAQAGPASSGRPSGPRGLALPRRAVLPCARRAPAVSARVRRPPLPRPPPPCALESLHTRTRGAGERIPAGRFRLPTPLLLCVPASLSASTTRNTRSSVYVKHMQPGVTLTFIAFVLSLPGSHKWLRCFPDGFILASMRSWDALPALDSISHHLLGQVLRGEVIGLDSSCTLPGWFSLKC